MSDEGCQSSRDDLLKHHPCVIVLAASLHVDSDYIAESGHGKVYVFSPVELRYTEDLNFEFLFRSPMSASVTSQGPVYDTLGADMLTWATCFEGW